MGKTVIWVQSSVLSKALEGEAGGDGGPKLEKKKSSAIDLDRSGGKWKWTRCELITGDISSPDNFTINGLFFVVLLAFQQLAFA